MPLLERRDVLYCGACGMPLEYCEYGPDFESHCNPWLRANHPNLFQMLRERNSGENKDAVAIVIDKKPRPTEPWTMEERLTAFYRQYQPDKLDSVPSLLEKYDGKEQKLFQALVKKYGPEPEDPYYAEDDDENDDGDEEDIDGGGADGGGGDDDDEDEEVSDKKGDKKKRRGAQAKKVEVVDTRIVIQKITRNKKKATTVVVGMDTVPQVKLKDVSKAFSKRFAGSSSVKEKPSLKEKPSMKEKPKRQKEIILQGDHMEEVADFVVSKFGVPPTAIYLDIDGEFVPFQE